MIYPKHEMAGGLWKTLFHTLPVEISVLGRRAALLQLKDAVKGGQAVEAGVHGNLGDGNAWFA